MKKYLIALSVLAFFLYVPSAKGITITEDFASYSELPSIIGQGGPGNWGDVWGTKQGDPTFVFDSGSGKLSATGVPSCVFRPFNTMLSSIDANGISFDIKQTNASVQNVPYGMFSTYDSGFTRAIVIGFINFGGNLQLHGITTTGASGTVLANGLSTGTYYTVTVTQVDFDNDRYKAKVGAGAESDWIAFVDSNTVSEFSAVSLMQTNFASSDYATNYDTISISGVPEPTTCALFGFGLIGLLYSRRKSKKK
jgi:hypothetical protein